MGWTSSIAVDEVDATTSLGSREAKAAQTSSAPNTFCPARAGGGWRSSRLQSSTSPREVGIGGTLFIISLLTASGRCSSASMLSGAKVTGLELPHGLLGAKGVKETSDLRKHDLRSCQEFQRMMSWMMWQRNQLEMVLGQGEEMGPILGVEWERLLMRGMVLLWWLLWGLLLRVEHPVNSGNQNGRQSEGLLPPSTTSSEVQDGTARCTEGPMPTSAANSGDCGLAAGGDGLEADVGGLMFEQLQEENAQLGSQLETEKKKRGMDGAGTDGMSESWSYVPACKWCSNTTPPKNSRVHVEAGSNSTTSIEVRYTPGGSDSSWSSSVEDYAGCAWEARSMRGNLGNGPTPSWMKAANEMAMSPRQARMAWLDREVWALRDTLKSGGGSTSQWSPYWQQPTFRWASGESPPVLNQPGHGGGCHQAPLSRADHGGSFQQAPLSRANHGGDQAPQSRADIPGAQHGQVSQVGAQQWSGFASWSSTWWSGFASWSSTWWSGFASWSSTWWSGFASWSSTWWSAWHVGAQPGDRASQNGGQLRDRALHHGSQGGDQAEHGGVQSLGRGQGQGLSAGQDEGLERQVGTSTMIPTSQVGGEGQGAGGRVELPSLPEKLNPMELGDWLCLIGPIMKDISINSSLWWKLTMESGHLLWSFASTGAQSKAVVLGGNVGMNIRRFLINPHVVGCTPLRSIANRIARWKVLERINRKGQLGGVTPKVEVEKVEKAKEAVEVIPKRKTTASKIQLWNQLQWQTLDQQRPLLQVRILPNKRRWLIRHLLYLLPHQPQLGSLWWVRLRVCFGVFGSRRTHRPPSRLVRWESFKRMKQRRVC